MKHQLGRILVVMVAAILLANMVWVLTTAADDTHPPELPTLTAPAPNPYPEPYPGPPTPRPYPAPKGYPSYLPVQVDVESYP